MKKQKIREINPRRLYYFREVIKQGSLSKAAWNLGTSPSVVTRQIDLLENELGGVRLFERRQSAGTKPTEAAQIVVQYCQRNYANLDALEQDLNAWQNMEKGDISIAVLPVYTEALIGNILNPFYSTHHNININIQEVHAAPQIETEVREDTAHIGITASLLQSQEGISCYASVPAPISLLVGKTHPLARKQKVEFSEAARYPLGLFPVGFNVRQRVQLAEHEEKTHVTPALISNGLAPLMKMAYNHSYYATFADVFTARQEIETGQLTTLEIDSPIFQSQKINIIVRQGRPLSPVVHQFLQLLAAKLPIFGC